MVRTVICACRNTVKHNLILLKANSEHFNRSSVQLLQEIITCWIFLKITRNSLFWWFFSSQLLQDKLFRVDLTKNVNRYNDSNTRTLKFSANSQRVIWKRLRAIVKRKKPACMFVDIPWCLPQIYKLQS